MKQLNHGWNREGVFVVTLNFKGKELWDLIDLPEPIDFDFTQDMSQGIVARLVFRGMVEGIYICRWLVYQGREFYIYYREYETIPEYYGQATPEVVRYTILKARFEKDGGYEVDNMCSDCSIVDYRSCSNWNKWFYVRVASVESKCPYPDISVIDRPSEVLPEDREAF